MDSLKAAGILSLGVSRHVQRLSCRGQTSPLDRGLITFWRRAPSTAPSPVGARLPRVAALNEGMSSSAHTDV